MRLHFVLYDIFHFINIHFVFVFFDYLLFLAANGISMEGKTETASCVEFEKEPIFMVNTIKCPI